MARIISTILLIVLLNVLAGCNGIDSGKGQLMLNPRKSLPDLTTVIQPETTSETDLIEQMSVNRQAYRAGLISLIQYYDKTGNNMKLKWARKESKASDSAPKYSYIIEASLAGPNLKATTSIPEADNLYTEAVYLEKKARRLVVICDDDLLRITRDKYNQLIRKHPSSDKIDDAAFGAAGIFEHFQDYSIALLYYQRTYQWDPKTPHPAEYKAAYILDKHLKRRVEALELYRKALKKGNLQKSYKEYAQERIELLTRSDETD